jgi:hypothetical protein
MPLTDIKVVETVLADVPAGVTVDVSGGAVITTGVVTGADCGASCV